MILTCIIISKVILIFILIHIQLLDWPSPSDNLDQQIYLDLEIPKDENQLMDKSLHIDFDSKIQEIGK